MGHHRPIYYYNQASGKILTRKFWNQTGALPDPQANVPAGGKKNGNRLQASGVPVILSGYRGLSS